MTAAEATRSLRKEWCHSSGHTPEALCLNMDFMISLGLGPLLNYRIRQTQNRDFLIHNDIDISTN